MNRLEQSPVLTMAVGFVTYATTISLVISHCCSSTAVVPAHVVAVTMAIVGVGSQQKQLVIVAVGDDDDEAQAVAAWGWLRKKPAMKNMTNVVILMRIELYVQWGGL